MKGTNNSKNVEKVEFKSNTADEFLRYFNSLDETEKGKTGEEIYEAFATQPGLRDCALWGVSFEFNPQKGDGELSKLREHTRILFDMPCMKEHWAKVKDAYRKEFVEFVDATINQDR